MILTFAVPAVLFSTSGVVLTSGANAESLNNLLTFFKAKFKTENFTKIFKKILIPVGAAIVLCAGLRYIANSFIFCGSGCNMEATYKIDNKYSMSNPIRIGDLFGRDFKLKNPLSNVLEGKCVLVFGPNASSSVNMALYMPSLFRLLNKGATLIAVDYRGYGNSAPISRLKISEKTVYEDGENIYKYARKTYKPEDIILFSYSLGGAVSSHVLAYASNKGEDLCGIILASPIDNLYSAASAFTCEPLGAIARVVSMSDLNTEKNLSMVKNKNIPIFLCSGDSMDVLSLEKTKLHEKITDKGFRNVTVNIRENCDHCDLMRMFYSDDSFSFKVYDNYIEKLVKKKR